MARARNIKPSFFANDDLADIHPLGRLLFIGLWTLADREGRLEDRPRRIKAEVLPYDDCDVDGLLDDLQKHGFIQRYDVGGERFIQVVNFKKHQNPHVKESASSIPAPDEHHASPVQDKGKEQPEPERAGLIPDSGFLIPDSNTHPLPFPAVRETIERCAQRARKGSAESFHNDLMTFLREEGWTLTAEHQVEDRGDGRQGRVDILVTSPAVVGIELDRLSIREKSVFKLSQVEGYRVAVLREAAEHDGHADLDAVICCGTAKVRERKPRIQLKTFIENCRAAGENAISGYQPLLSYVEETGLPMEFVQLAWDEFKRNFGPGGKDEARMQADWRRHFLNFVEKNYLRLWAARVGENGNEYFLTTQGLQAQALHRRREGVAA